jgi:hypothetical protein
MNRVTTSAKRGASAEETHSILNRFGSIPQFSSTIFIALSLVFAF